MAGGGRPISLANRLRFCAIAANLNSNCAPRGPEALIPPKARLLIHGDGSVAFVPAVQYSGGVGEVGSGLMPCIINWI